MMTHAILDGTRVLRLVPADECGAVALLAPLAHWPEAPHPGAELHCDAGALVWQDPRTSAQRAADARARRDTLLTETDWMVTRAFETSAAMPSAWADYRAALRDLPEQPGFPDSITWPTPPSA